MGENEIISSKVRNKTKKSTLPTLTQFSMEILIQGNKARERKKSNLNSGP
jgi:hypothetical protein